MPGEALADQVALGHWFFRHALWRPASVLGFSGVNFLHRLVTSFPRRRGIQRRTTKTLGPRLRGDDDLGELWPEASR